MVWYWNGRVSEWSNEHVSKTCRPERVSRVRIPPFPQRFCYNSSIVDIKLVMDKITIPELKELSKVFYRIMIKGVVDIERGSIAFGGEYHIDANMVLVANGSLQKDIWGFNFYFDRPPAERLEYTSLINIRPQAGNFDMEVQSKTIRDKMKTIINFKVR